MTEGWWDERTEISVTETTYLLSFNLEILSYYTYDPSNCLILLIKGTSRVDRHISPMYLWVSIMTILLHFDFQIILITNRMWKIYLFTVLEKSFHHIKRPVRFYHHSSSLLVLFIWPWHYHFLNRKFQRRPRKWGTEFLLYLTRLSVVWILLSQLVSLSDPSDTVCLTNWHRKRQYLGLLKVKNGMSVSPVTFTKRDRDTFEGLLVVRFERGVGSNKDPFNEPDIRKYNKWKSTFFPVPGLVMLKVVVEWKKTTRVLSVTLLCPLSLCLSVCLYLLSLSLSLININFSEQIE